jgi:PAS domain S-box-containing protein
MCSGQHLKTASNELAEAGHGRADGEASMGAPTTRPSKTTQSAVAKTIIRLVISMLAVLAITAVRFAVHVQPDRVLSLALNLFLIVVLAAAIRWGTRFAIFLSSISALAFSLSLAPAGHLHLNDARVWTLLTACLVTGLVAGQLSGRARREAIIANQRRAEAMAAQQRFADLVNSVEGIVWEADPETVVFSFVSEQAKRILGYPAAQWLREPSFWKEHLHPEDRDWVVNQCLKAAAEKRNHDLEYRMIAADGRVVWIRDLVTVVFENGRPARLLGVKVDFTKRKVAESLLAGEKRILEMVAKGDSLPEVLDGLCRLVEEQASGVLASILLLDGDRLRHGAAPSLPKTYTEAIDGATIGPSEGSCGTAAYRGEQVIVEDIATDPLWAKYRELALPHSLRACWSTPVFSSEGKVIATFAMYYRQPRRPSSRDQEIIEQITHLAGVAIERNLTQEALRRSEAYLSEAQRLSHTGSWAFKGTKFLYWSEENFRIWGFDHEQGLPNRTTILQYIHPEDRDRVIESTTKAVTDQKDCSVEFRILLPDGSVRHVQALGHPVFNASGDLVEVIGTQMDITERKHAEEERERLQQLEADLAHINRVTTMGELTASLSHELNQPIAAAITNASTCLRWLAGEKPNIEEARDATKRIVKDATRAAEIISRIRSLFKKSTPERALVDVNEVINEMVVLLRNEASRNGVSVRTNLGAGLPPVMGDRVQLQQVLMNLMINGIDAMKGVDGSRELTLSSQRDTGDQVLISVSDNGIGLPPNIKDDIFNAFFTTKPQGTGMGLAISRSIVESHGGRLWTNSNSSRGATFLFTLPATNQG